MTLISLNQSAHLINQTCLLCALFISQHQGRNMTVIQNKNINSNSKVALKNTGYLSSVTIQKMILRLIKDASISRPKLAGYLDIATLDLLKLTEDRASLNLVQKISLPVSARLTTSIK